MQFKEINLSRATLALVLVFSGLLILPLTGLSAEELNWQQFASAYSADLDVLSDDDQAYPGSAFHFSATGFPAYTVATAEIDGRTRGAVKTDSNGRADFLIQTDSADAEGRFYVSVYSDANYYATDDFRLRLDKDFQGAPSGWGGDIFTLWGPAKTLTVNHPAGENGSAFVFTASGFPANASMNISVDGEQLHTMTTNSSGTAQFAMQSGDTNARAANDYGAYYVSVEVGGTAYALSACEISSTEPVWELPNGFNGPVIALNNTVPTSVTMQHSEAQSSSAMSWLLLLVVTVAFATAALLWIRPKPHNPIH